MMFLRDEDYVTQRDAIAALLGERLPPTYRGYSTHYSAPNPDDENTQLMTAAGSGPINHRVECYTVDTFFESYLGLNVVRELGSFDWLTLPQQKLRSVTSGGVFRDDLGLNAIRQRLAWYPDDVWLYLLASTWQRIGQEEHLVGRAASVSDQIGSSLIAARLVRDLMRLTFLMERVYAPYPKWFGTAFNQLRAAPELSPALQRVLRARTWSSRERALGQSYAIVAGLHRALSLTEPLPLGTKRFWSRPFQVIGGEAYATALTGEIEDAAIANLARTHLIGSLDVFSDSTDVLENASLNRTLRALYPRDEGER